MEELTVIARHSYQELLDLLLWFKKDGLCMIIKIQIFYIFTDDDWYEEIFDDGLLNFLLEFNIMSDIKIIISLLEKYKVLSYEKIVEIGDETYGEKKCDSLFLGIMDYGTGNYRGDFYSDRVRARLDMSPIRGVYA